MAEGTTAADAPPDAPVPLASGCGLAAGGDSGQWKVWPMSACLGPVGALPAACHLARTFTALILGGWGLSAVSDTSELIVSEFAANVIRAASPDGNRCCHSAGRLPFMSLRLMTDLARLRIEVWDDLPASFGAPAVRRAAPGEESGRGLELVEALSLNWGWEHIPGHAAKRVWALLSSEAIQPPE